MSYKVYSIHSAHAGDQISLTNTPTICSTNCESSLSDLLALLDIVADVVDECD
jgi:hypothetical protein